MNNGVEAFHSRVIAWVRDLVVWNEYPALGEEMVTWLEMRWPIWEPALSCCMDELGLDQVGGVGVVASWFVLFGVSSSLDNLVDGDKLTQGWKSIGGDAGIMVGLAIVQDAVGRLIRESSGDVAVILTGAVREAALGEAADLIGVKDLDEYEAVLERKAAVLVSALFESLAVAANASQPVVKGLKEFGRRVGLAIQVFNDYCGIWKPAEIGLDHDGDLRGPGGTYPLLYLTGQKNADGEEAVKIMSQPGSGRDVGRLYQLLEQRNARGLLGGLLASHRVGCKASLPLSDAANDCLMKWADAFFFIE